MKCTLINSYKPENTIYDTFKGNIVYLTYHQIHNTNFTKTSYPHILRSYTEEKYSNILYFM